jgi:hypothetical protein
MSKDALAERMERLGIRDSDLEKTFARRAFQKLCKEK